MVEDQNVVDVISFLPLLQIDCIHSHIIECFQSSLRRYEKTSQRNTKRQKVSYTTQEKQEKEEENKMEINEEENEQENSFNEIISSIIEYGLNQKVTINSSTEEMLTSSIILRSIICILLPYRDNIEQFKKLLSVLSDFIRFFTPKLANETVLEMYSPIFSVLFQSFFEVCKVIDIRQLEEDLTNIVMEVLELNWIENLKIEDSKMIST